MPFNRYINAEGILPPELVEQIQNHFSGGYLYIPSRKYAARIKRNLEVVRMFNDGKSIAEIADTYLLTRGAVRFILQKAGKK
ncbi:MAG TPA: Mor transcription activator family protein [bacterium]|mgnify:FL=1|nr:Mor transcription activator family protein [bacterium]